MKRLKALILPGIAVVTLVALSLSGLTGASAAILPQHTHGPATCGGWSKVSSPNLGTSTNFLNGVAAISAKDVWAVGDYGNGNGSLTLVEHWNGTRWKVVASPNVNNSLSDSLSGVAAIAANNIWAVGNYNDASNTQQTLIEHWNGTKWSIVQSPNVQSQFNVLTTISPVSAKDIWAVGNASGGNGSQTLIEHWNGAKWSIVQSQGTTGGLSGIAAIASNDVWAIGAISRNNILSLTEHWNGSAWSVVSSSGPGLTINKLNGIAAISANNVWAVGDDADSATPSTQFRPLIEQWNGSSWSVVTSPVRGTSDFLNGIAAISASNIWAVGSYRTSLDPYGPYFTFIEHWNGSAWSVVKSPSPGLSNNGLAAATHVPATTSVWAVGFKQSSNIYQTLTEFYC